jgi:pimeloyl-ACP methyl ester carboxylesterase
MDRANSRKELPVTEPNSDTLDVPGAVLHYDVRSHRSGADPVLLMIGSPMCADGFVTLAGHFPDRTVITYDPRSAGRSQRTDGVLINTPDEHADDLHRLIHAQGAGQADIFASSGGAVNALTLAARHPEQVRTLVAHEPPAFRELPDGEYVLAACADIHQTYQRGGSGQAMAKFFALVTHQGPIPADYLSWPAPDPVAFGLPAADDGSRNHPLMANMRWCEGYRHDFDALRASPARIVMGVGKDSAATVAGRAAIAVAGRLGTPPVTFPGGHEGFLAGEPDAFAATLRKVLSQS